MLAADLSIGRLARGTRENLVGIVAERIFGVTLLIALPLLLQPRQLGSYYEIFALLTLCVVAGLFGLDVGVTRFTALASEGSRFGDIRHYLRAGLLFGVSSSSVVVLALWVLAPSLAQLFGVSSLAFDMRLGALAIPFLVAAYVLVAPAKGLKLMWPAVIAIQFVQPGVQLGATLGLILFVNRLHAAIGAYTASAIAACLAAAYLWRRLRLPREPSPSEPVGSGLLRFSAPISGTTLMGTALLWIDTLLLGAFRAPPEVAAYGIVVRVLTLSYAVYFTIVQIFGPFVTQLVARGDQQRLTAVLHTVTRWVMILTGPLLFLIMIEGRPILRVFGQQDVRAAAIATVILAAAFFFDVLTGPLAHLLTMSGRPLLNLMNNSFAVVLNVGLNLILIPHLGVIGAAISWAAVIFGLSVARFLEVRAVWRIGPFTRELVRPGIFLSLSAVAAWFVERAMTHVSKAPILALGASALLFVILYLTLMLAAGLHPEDRILLRAIVHRRTDASASESVAGQDGARDT